MAYEDTSEDRLTKNEFAELIQHLSVQEILTIEYRVDTSWKTSSFKSLLEHIDGRKHKLQMESVEQLYHPDYTYPKNYKNEGIDKSLTKKHEDGTVSSTLKDNLNTSNSPRISGNNDEKLQKIEKNKSSNIKSDEKSVRYKTVVKSKIVGAQSNLDSCLKTPNIDKQIEEKDAFLCDYGCKKVEVKNSEVDQNQEWDSMSKVNLESLDVKPNSKETKTTTKVVGEKRSLMESSIEVNFKKRKTVINPAAALSLMSSSIKGKVGKNEESSKNPPYQTDKIIIPTVHKNKSRVDKTLLPTTSQTQSNDLPKFSVKSYSSNPSDNDVHGILGVEYVIKILKNRNDLSPRYQCGLCELVLDGFAMQRHLEGYNHRLKFCEKHFPTAIRQYRQYMQNVPEPEIFKVMAPVLAKLAMAIEQHHGRNLPYECYERDFSLNHHEILAKAFSCRHASEEYGPTFTHVVGSKEIDELINNRHKYLPPPFSRATIFDNKPGSSKSSNHYQNSRLADKQSNSRDRHRHAGPENAISSDTTYKSYMSSGVHEDMCPPSNTYKPADIRHVVQHVDDETYNLMVDDFLKGTLKGLSRNSTLRNTRKRSLSPARTMSSAKRKSLSPLRQNDIWQAYRHMVDQELYNLDERFNHYRKDPETHPSYNEEWQKFWKCRKDELVSAGLDHRKYNYQPEWVRFVKIRIEELYSQEVENLKIKSRERLCLPLTNDHIPDVKYHVRIPNVSPSNELLTLCNSKPIIGLSTSSNNNTPEVVSVLRLMTALEDSLGSLGPKIIDLLSKALQAEKNNPLNVSAIILTHENCSLIETAKEKLKGLVMTGLFEGSKKRVLNQVVNDAEAILQYAFQFKQQLGFQRSSAATLINQNQHNSSLSFETGSPDVSSTLKNQQKQSGGSISLLRKTHSSSATITENLLERVDKKELASKLAASLVAQGKTDFDPQQLQQLIAVYKLIEKKKHENAGTVLFNKGGCPFQESISPRKKTLSDTLSDLLKPSPSSVYTNSDDTNISNTSHSALGSSNQIPGGTQFSTIIPSGFRNGLPLNSSTNALQNSSSNYFYNTSQSMANAFGSNSRGVNQVMQRNNYGMNYTNNLLPNQQNSNMSNFYNDQYQNKWMTQNWGRNPSMEINQNFDMGGPNWKKF